MLGAAAAALLAATGTARAADVMPIVVAVTPTVPPAVIGPTVNIDIRSTISLYYYGPSALYVDANLGGDIDVRSASGWGVRLSGGGGFSIYPGMGYGFGFSAELYKAIGNAQLGFFVSPYGFNPIDISFGPTLRYETDTVDFRHSTEFSFWGGGNRAVDVYNELTLNPNDRLEVGGYFDLGFSNVAGRDLEFGGFATVSLSDRVDMLGWADVELDGGLWFGTGAGVELHFGALTPYANVGWTTSDGLWTELGFDVKKPIGAGPLQLIGGARAYLWSDPALSVNLSAYAGIRYLIGEDDDDY